MFQHKLQCALSFGLSVCLGHPCKCGLPLKCALSAHFPNRVLWEVELDLAHFLALLDGVFLPWVSLAVSAVGRLLLEALRSLQGRGILLDTPLETKPTGDIRGAACLGCYLI